MTVHAQTRPLLLALPYDLTRTTATTFTLSGALPPSVKQMAATRVAASEAISCASVAPTTPVKVALEPGPDKMLTVYSPIGQTPKSAAPLAAVARAAQPPPGVLPA